MQGLRPGQDISAKELYSGNGFQDRHAPGLVKGCMTFGAAVATKVIHSGMGLSVALLTSKNIAQTP